MKIVIITDAWYPQINGVVRTLDKVGEELRNIGHEVAYITPDTFPGIRCPTYPEIKLCYRVRSRLARLIDGLQPCAIHVATEGPLGFAARRYCLKRKLPFTTAYHTRFPEYVQARFRIPTTVTYALLRRFHRPSTRVMVATASLHAELAERGFNNLVAWSRGVDVDLFHPRSKDFLHLPRPIFIYVGRVAVEKNISAFLDLDLPGSKLVVGDGPQLGELRQRYPEVHFVGAKHGEELAKHYAASDVFVFPSRTDTFGLVVLEALASGLPVAAYPVMGPMDVIGDHGVGMFSENLAAAARAALNIPSEDCRRFAMAYSWRASAEQFLQNLEPLAVSAIKEPAAASPTRSHGPSAMPGGNKNIIDSSFWRRLSAAK